MQMRECIRRTQFFCDYIIYHYCSCKNCCDFVLKELSERQEAHKETIMTNPYLSEDLQDYEDNLQDAIDSYSDRLDKIVWESFTEEERQKIWLVLKYVHSLRLDQ